MAERHIVAHVPVISRGYLDFFEHHADSAFAMHVVDDTLLNGMDGVRKDLRRLNPDQSAELLQSYLHRAVRPIGDIALSQLVHNPDVDFIMPRDDISMSILERFSISPERAKLVAQFLRWDRTNVASEHDVDTESVQASEIPSHVKSVLDREVRQSVDWWRQVGCVFFDDNRVLSAQHNQYRPFQYSAETDGDVRSQSYRGTAIEVANAQHAEAAAIAQAAKQGTKLEGSKCIVSTFPCPVCAKLLADTGIETLYFSDGYSMTDGENVLRAQGIEIRRVSLQSVQADTKPVQYPSAKS
ncbi:hypothetical protein KC973_00705 [Candidatus Saccharibacteria bacterium]|nr:hypothetical protein [Candidatus Saccharibacteria bacterium]